MFEVCDNNYDSRRVCYINTEEEAKRICDYANAHEKDYFYHKLLVSTANKEIARIKRIKTKEKVGRISALTERIKRVTTTIATLKKCKEFLDRYLIGVDDFIPLIPEMYEAVLKTDLPISFYDGKQSYSRNGIIKTGEERLSYAPIYITMGVDWDFYQYENGNYDIEDDIKRLENVVSRYKAELAREQKGE